MQPSAVPRKKGSKAVDIRGSECRCPKTGFVRFLFGGLIFLNDCTVNDEMGAFPSFRRKMIAWFGSVEALREVAYFRHSRKVTIVSNSRKVTPKSQTDQTTDVMTTVFILNDLNNSGLSLESP
jgi:hypothetical protein